MHKILQDIIIQKQKEVHVLKENPGTLVQLKNISTGRSGYFKQAIAQGPLSFIAEIKRKSPAKGDLNPNLDITALVQEYIKGGASAISVLTDSVFFNGSLQDLEMVSTLVKPHKTPILRKDFMIDAIQIAQSIQAGADAILLIVSVLKEKTADLLAYAKKHGIDAIVEVHNLQELELAIDIGADIIGINNRDLSTFAEDLNTCLNLAPMIPPGIVTIAESSIKTTDDIEKIKKAGFDAVLIGEALVTAPSPSNTLKKLRGVL